jgi:hypothetical protein
MHKKRGQLVFPLAFKVDREAEKGEKTIKTAQIPFPIDSENLLVGLPGFEPESIEPKSTSLDQASREPHFGAENIIWQEP